jgi:hypothetical protein
MSICRFSAVFAMATLSCGFISAHAQTVLTTDTIISDARYTDGVEVRDGTTPPTHILIEAGAAFPDALRAAVEAFDSSQILIRGGELHAPGGLWLWDRAEAVIEGGSFRGFSPLAVNGESRLVLRNGVVFGQSGLFLDEAGKARMEGGEIHGFVGASVLHSAVFDIHGGLLYGSGMPLAISSGGTVNLYGGVLQSDTGRAILVQTGGVLNIYGTELAWDPMSGLLTGSLARGGAIEGRIELRNGGILNLVAVPEPGVIALLAALGVGSVCLRRTRNREEYKS